MRIFKNKNMRIFKLNGHKHKQYTNQENKTEKSVINQKVNAKQYAFCVIELLRLSEERRF